MLKQSKEIIPIFDHPINVVVSDNADELNQYIAKEIGHDDSGGFEARTYLVSSSGEMESYVLFNTSYNTTAGTIAHESLHVVDDVMTLIGETNKGRETPAYLLEYVTNICSSALVKAGYTINVK